MAFIPGNTGTASTFPDGFQIADGTVTAPTLKFSDSQTGWYRPGLNQMALASNGVQTLLVSASGNIGVGTASPATKLHVNTAGNTSAGGISLRNAGNQQHFWYLSSNTNSRFEIGSSAGTWDWVNSNGTMLTIGSTGAVTLGASGTAAAHTVQGSVGADFQLKVVNSNATNGSGLRVQSGTATNATTVQSWFGSGTNVGFVTGDGAWTVGPASNSALTHTVNGSAIVQLNHNGAARIDLQNNGNGANLAVDTQISTIQFSGRFNSTVNDLAGIRGYYRGNGTTRSGSLDFYTYDAGSIITAISTSSAGAVTLGASTGTSRNHVINMGDGTSDALIQVNTSAATAVGVDTNVSVRINGANQAQIGSYRNAGTGANGAGYLFVRNGNGTDYVYYVGNDANFRQSTSKNDVGLTAGTIVGTQTSDQRLKSDIQDLSEGLTTILALRPVSFKFNHTPDRTRLGFIAQEAESVIPSAVYEGGSFSPENDRYKNMEYTEIVAPLVKAIQELHAELQAAKDRIATLEGGN